MMRWHSDESEYRRLLRLIGDVNDRAHPDGFLFWVRHTPCAGAWELWMQCPRVEWMLWLAELCGVPEWRREAVRTGVENAKAKWRKADDGEAATPNVDGASLARELMHWTECWAAMSQQAVA